MLEINNLYAGIDGKEILHGVNLSIGVGEVHAVMGQNGAGKSTLSNVIAGRPGYTITDGEILYRNENLLTLSPNERACRGIFLASQYPVELPGVNNMYFLRTAFNAQRRALNEKELDAKQFLSRVRQDLKDLNMPEDLLQRPVNVGFSGGEKKRNEILQMTILQPSLAVLDETDSGLDIDALKTVTDGINRLRNKQRSFLIITHYQRMLDYVVPDYVHILADGVIVQSGDKTLAKRLENEGYSILSQSLKQNNCHV